MGENCTGKKRKGGERLEGRGERGEGEWLEGRGAIGNSFGLSIADFESSICASVILSYVFCNCKKNIFFRLRFSWQQNEKT